MAERQSEKAYRYGLRLLAVMRRSDAHEGLKKALGRVLAGVSSQNCRVHFALAPQCGQSSPRRIGRRHTRSWRKSCGRRGRDGGRQLRSWGWPKPTSWPTWSSQESAGHVSTRRAHWTASAVRSNVGRKWWVGSPTAAQHAPSLAGAVLQDTADEWQVGRRCFGLETMARLIGPELLLIAKAVAFHLALVH